MLNLVLLLTDADSIIVMCFLSSESTEMSDAEADDIHGFTVLKKLPALLVNYATK